jgi:hypothetical protein
MENEKLPFDLEPQVSVKTPVLIKDSLMVMYGDQQIRSQKIIVSASYQPSRQTGGPQGTVSRTQGQLTSTTKACVNPFTSQQSDWTNSSAARAAKLKREGVMHTEVKDIEKESEVPFLSPWALSQFLSVVDSVNTNLGSTNPLPPGANSICHTRKAPSP